MVAARTGARPLTFAFWEKRGGSYCARSGSSSLCCTKPRQAARPATPPRDPPGAVNAILTTAHIEHISLAVSLCVSVSALRRSR